LGGVLLHFSRRCVSQSQRDSEKKNEIEIEKEREIENERERERREREIARKSLPERALLPFARRFRDDE